MAEASFSLRNSSFLSRVGGESRGLLLLVLVFGVRSLRSCISNSPTCTSVQPRFSKIFLWILR